MKKCCVAVAALCAVVLLSFAVYAAKGPCVGGGSESNTSTTFSSDGKTKTIENYTIHTDQSCADQNENTCSRAYIDPATRKEGTRTTYKKNSSGEWEQDGQPESFIENGKYVC